MFGKLLANKKLLGTLGIILLGFVVYTVWLKPDTSTEPIITSQQAQQSAVGGEILSLLTDLQEIRLDGSIFQDPAFNSLEDFSVLIDPQPQGRVNPFAPLGNNPVVPQQEETDDENEEGGGPASPAGF